MKNTFRHSLAILFHPRDMYYLFIIAFLSLIWPARGIAPLTGILKWINLILFVVSLLFTPKTCNLNTYLYYVEKHVNHAEVIMTRFYLWFPVVVFFLALIPPFNQGRLALFMQLFLVYYFKRKFKLLKYILRMPCEIHDENNSA